MFIVYDYDVHFIIFACWKSLLFYIHCFYYWCCIV